MRKLIRLRQANRIFAELYTEFSMYIVGLDLNNKVLKCHLKYELSKELSRQLVSINFKDLTNHQLVQKCQTQDNLLHASAIQPRKITRYLQLPVKSNQQYISTHSQAVIPVITFKPAPPNANAIDLTCSKLTTKMKKYYQTEGLYFYCGQAGYQTFSCSIKPANKYIRAIQDTQDIPAA